MVDVPWVLLRPLSEIVGPLPKRSFHSMAVINGGSILTTYPPEVEQPNRKGSSSNHHFSGVNSLLNFGGVLNGMVLRRVGIFLGRRGLGGKLIIHPS